MNKHEFELSKLAAKARIIEIVVGLIRTILICGTFLGAVWLILTGIKPIISGQDATQIEALAKVVESFKLGSIFSYGIAVITGIAWAVERKGKQRAISEKAHFQKIAEQSEQNRCSSGLTTIGQTPESK